MLIKVEVQIVLTFLFGVHNLIYSIHVNRCRFPIYHEDYVSTHAILILIAIQAPVESYEGRLCTPCVPHGFLP